MKTDILYAIENIIPVKRMRRLILAITCNCNSKCKTCSIWKKNYKDELSLEDLKKFTETRLFKKIRFISLTGGEPFLRNDIDEIVNLSFDRMGKLSLMFDNINEENNINHHMNNINQKDNTNSHNLNHKEIKEKEKQ